MDLTTTTTTPTPTKSADSENDTPPHVQPIKSLSFTNGAIKKHNFHHHRHRQPPPAVVVTYKDCLKNHAASIGGHAVDGCGEFMPCSTANPTDPTSLKCAACGCHRNFHRREPDEYCAPTIATAATTTHFLDFQRHPPPPPPSGRFSSSPSPPPPPPPQPSSYAPPNMLLALSTAVLDDLQPTNQHHHHVATPMTPTTLKGETNSSGRKRFRTRFTQDQKEKMHSFAEKLGWKMQKTDEAIIEEFCDEIGVARGVLKVWMHNNKHSSAKKDINHSSNINMNNNNDIQHGRVISFQNNDYNDDNKNNDAVHDLHVSANGSSSSS